MCELNHWLMDTAQKNKLIFVDYYRQMIQPESGELMEDAEKFKSVREGIAGHPAAAGYIYDLVFLHHNFLPVNAELCLAFYYIFTVFHG